MGTEAGECCSCSGMQEALISQSKQQKWHTLSRGNLAGTEGGASVSFPPGRTTCFWIPPLERKESNSFHQQCDKLLPKKNARADWNL